jgi:L-asparaginase
VSVVYVHPGIRPETIRRSVLGGDIRGVVLAVFGVGNAPSLENALGAVLTDIVQSGVDVLAVTQWGGSIDLGAYATGQALGQAGVVPGGRMHIEAALPKMMAALARFDSHEERRRWLTTDIAGEYDA